MLREARFKKFKNSCTSLFKRSNLRRLSVRHATYFDREKQKPKDEFLYGSFGQKKLPIPGLELNIFDGRMRKTRTVGLTVF